MTERDDLIKSHSKIRLTKFDVERRLNLSLNDCHDQVRVRNFCAKNQITLPDMIEIEVIPYPDDNKRSEQFQWHVVIYEQPNLKAGA